MNTIQDLVSFANMSRSNEQNEAETRHKIIDTIIHNIMSWPKNRVKVEDYIKPGFADYVLTASDGNPLLFVEAKRSGKYFELPIPYKEGELSCYILISQLLSEENIRDAMVQVRTYCFDVGCEYAAITNGHEWVLFKTFEKGKRWENLKAFVIRKIEFFSSEHTKAINFLSYTAITERASLQTVLTSIPPRDRDIYFYKDKIPSYSHSINANRLANFLRPIVTNLFGNIGDDQIELMDRCYVSERDYSETSDGMKSLLHDSLTPYFEEYGVKQLEDTGKGGSIGGKITKNLKNKRGAEVLILFGGKGAGKSTFIKRLLHHTPPRWLIDHAVVALIDLLKVPEEPGVIRQDAWSKLVTELDSDRILESDRDNITKELFSDRYAIALKQELSGLDRTSEAYNRTLNELISSWKADPQYCAHRLKEYWANRGRGVIVVVDNTDQFSGSVQDFCFSTAQEICSKLNCITLISMREERFYNSKIHGLLDAFQNSGFHISSPKPSSVFIKRIEYTVLLLRNRSRREEITDSDDDELIESSCKYLEIVASAFRYSSSPLNEFLTACGHGDIRLSLDLFRKFLLSGYTNVEEMLTAGSWTFQIHQVVKPVMTPTRFFYDEKLSDIPNIFQIRDPRNSSHFTSLRILRRLAKGMDSGRPAFHQVAELRAYFSEKFRIVADLEMNLDILLKHGFVEANTRIDYFDDSIDQIRMTSYGRYMYDEMSHFFTYLDIICLDCGVFEQSVANYMCESAKDEYKLFLDGKRNERITLRLERVEKFIEYLRSEEIRENDFYGLNILDTEFFTSKAAEEFKVEKARISRSAAKQKTKRSRSGQSQYNR